MMTEIEYPEIRWVIPGVHRADGAPNGEPPRMRHHKDCTHYNFRGGKRWGNPVEATEEQMRNLRACSTCVKKHA